MNSKHLLILLASWIVVELCQVPPYPSPYYPAFPSYGDLRLCDSSLVMIYMAPDGTNIEYMWGTISGSVMNHTGGIADTLCQQLGYDDGALVHKDSSNEAENYPVWISGVECNDTYQHILRCNYTDVPNPNTASHTDDVHLNCSKRVRPDHAYVGQAALIPPTSISTFNFSKSVGVVAYLEEPRQWRFIVNNSDFNLADTACRGMGFTHVVRNSVTTVKQYLASYGDNYTFGASLNELSASIAKCSGSFQCLGCCQFNSPKDNPDKMEAMIVRCSFYEPNLHEDFASSGYKNICKTEGQIKGKVCESEDNDSQNNCSVTTVASLGLFLVLFAIGMVFFIVLSIIFGVILCRHYGYIQLDGENRGGGGGGEEEEGGGGEEEEEGRGGGGGQETNGAGGGH